MSLSVGPVQSYVPGSTWFDLTQYSDFGLQEQVSVTLIPSNLWLVDQSQLNFDDTATANLAFLYEGQTYTVSVPLIGEGEASYSLPTLMSAATAYDSSLGFESPWQNSDYTQLSDIQISSSASSPGFSDGSGQSSSSSIIISYPSYLATAPSPDSPLFVGSPTSSSSLTDTPTSDSSSTTDGSPPILTTTDLTTPPTTDILTGITATPTPTGTVPPNPSPDPQPSPSAPIPVPFQADTTVGLLLVVLMVAGKRLQSVIKP